MSKRNGGIELRLQYAAATIGLFHKKDPETRLRAETEDELEEKILKPSSPEPHRHRMMIGSVSSAPHPGFIKYQRPRGQRLRRMKADIFHFLEGCRTIHSKIYHGFVFLLIVLSLALAIVLSMNDYRNNTQLRYSMLGTEYLLLLIFVVEYVLRVWSSSAHGHYGDLFGKIRYLLTPHMLIDLLVIGCSVGLILAKQQKLDYKTERMLHMLLLIRILRTDRQRGSFSMFQKVIMKHKKELLTCWYMSFIMIIFVAFMVYALETDPKEYTLNNLFNGFYWAVISLASIGYGDINPNTAIAKILICIIALVGTAFFAMPAGIIGSGFALQVAEHAKEKHANRKRRPAAILIQSFWRRFAGDHDLHATWLRHMINRESRRMTKQRIIKSHAVLHGNIPLSAVTSNELGDQPQQPANGNLPVQLKKLTLAEKNALRFIRRLKIRAALKMFKQARRPYDERDILDQFASGQIEMFAKLRQLSSKIENVSSNVAKRAVPDGLNQKMVDLEEEMSVLREDITETKHLLQELLTHFTKDKVPENTSNINKSAGNNTKNTKESEVIGRNTENNKESRV